MLETELFAQKHKNYGLATVRYPVLEVTATVEPFENGRGFTLRVLRVNCRSATWSGNTPWCLCRPPGIVNVLKHQTAKTTEMKL